MCATPCHTSVRVPPPQSSLRACRYDGYTHDVNNRLVIRPARTSELGDSPILSVSPYAPRLRVD
jgi:hypothetical protein